MDPQKECPDFCGCKPVDQDGNRMGRFCQRGVCQAHPTRRSATGGEFCDEHIKGAK